jgi:hypothetical protein
LIARAGLIKSHQSIGHHQRKYDDDDVIVSHLTGTF